MQAGIYRHYKGGLYQVLGVAQDSETEELVVVYVALTGADLPGPRMRVRPLHGEGGFSTYIKPTKDSNLVARFEYVGDSIK